MVAVCCIGSSVPSTEFLLLRIALLGNGRDAFSGMDRAAGPSECFFKVLIAVSEASEL